MGYIDIEFLIFIIILLFLLYLLYLLVNINYCKIGFNNKQFLTFDNIYELNKSKFYSIKGEKNEKSLISKIKNYNNLK
jgi:hypothetical protein